MGKNAGCPKVGMTKGAWTAIEDQILKDYVNVHGEGKWGIVPKRAGLKRCGKSCRLRWLNYLRPNIKRGNITPEEDDLIIRLHNLLGNRWSLIAGRLPGRTDNEIKNYWNTNLSRRAVGLKPTTRNTKNLTSKKIPNNAEFQNKTTGTSDPSSTSGSLVTPQVHQLPERYQFNGVVINNVEPVSTPPTSKDEDQYYASSDDFMADFDVGDLSSIMPELIGVDFANQTGNYEFLPFGHQQQHWSYTSSDQPKDGMEAEFGCWASLMGSSDHDQEWVI